MMAFYLLAIPIAIALIALFFFIRMIVQVIRQSRELDTQLADLLEQSQMRERARQRVSDSANRRPGLPARSILHDFELPNLWGGSVTLSQWKGQLLAVLFVQPSCPFSRDLIAKLLATQDILEGSNRQLISISNGTEAENRELFAGHTADTPILLQATNEVARHLHVSSTPSCYLIDENGITEGQIFRGIHEVLSALGVESDGEDVPDPEAWKSETTRFKSQTN